MGVRLPIHVFTFVAALLVLLGPACQQEISGLEEHARIQDPRVLESSGIVVSRQFDDVFWTHNDDGPASLFAIGLDGRKIRSYQLPIRNHDWEDIAVDKEGNLYLLDNTSRGDELWRNVIHVFPEPDPYRDEQVTSVETFAVRFADRGYDTETLFIWQNQLFLVTKPWDGLKPRIYVADNRQDGEAVFLNSLPYAAMVTGGDVNEEGNRVVLCSYRALFIFEGQGTLEEILAGDPLVCRLNAGQIEGVSWKGNDLILTNEQGSIFWVLESDWREHEAPYQGSPTLQVPRYAPGSLDNELPVNWKRGVWLTASDETSVKMGRVVWSDDGLHVGIQLPKGLEISALKGEQQEDLDDWFLPGRVYVLINPKGDRRMAFGSNDRCILLGNQSGVLSCEVRTLLPATYVQSSEMSPPWTRVERLGDWILLTLTAEGPGLDQMQVGDQMGFNLLIMGERSRVMSWASLTLEFSWDAPSFWGLIELADS